MLVGCILFEIVTGVLNIQYDYVFGFDFYTAHHWGAWVLISGFVVHVASKLPKMVSSLRTMPLRNVLRTSTADTEPETPDTDGLVSREPASPTMSRRGALALVGGGSALIAVLTAGQTIGGPVRQVALLLTRGRDNGDGPNDFPINRTAVAAGIDPAATGDRWQLTLRGGQTPIVLDRMALAAMPQHTAELPIACVEGWSITKTWSGVRLQDLAARTGIPAPELARVASLEQSGAFSRATLQGNQIVHPDSLLALRVNGEDLSIDHGFPARVIVPALPGVHNTKWVSSIEFEAMS